MNKIKEIKKIINDLQQVVRYATNLKLLLLSATPMFDSYKEIVWLLNLMNLNDRRSQIKVKDVFDNDGNFLEKDGEQIGRDLLQRKATGYVSYIIGENPYSFPYTIWPMQFAPNNSFKKESGIISDYPLVQLNEKKIIQPLEYLDVFKENIGEYQNKVYDHFY